MDTIHQPLFAQQLGLYSNQGFQPPPLFPIINKIESEYRFVSRYAFNHCNSEQHFSESLTDNENIVLSLNKPYQLLAAGYHRDRKARLNQALKHNISIQSGTTIEPLIEMFRENVEGRIYGGVSNVAYDYLRRIYQVTKEKKMGEVYYAYDTSNTILSGAFFVEFKKRITYLFNASFLKYRNLNARTLIINNIIEKYQNQNFVLDFESPSLESIKSFYKSFGGIQERYFTYSKNNLHPIVKKIHQLRMMIYRIG